MLKRQVGKSGMEFSPIGMGCWQFAGGTGVVGAFWDRLPQDQVDEIVAAGFENGINWFDTAEAYGWGASEQALAKALDSLGPQDDELYVATKWFPLFRFAGSLAKTIDKRIEALDRRRIDLHQVHFPLSFSRIERQMEVMAGLQRQGKIRFVGVSNFSDRQMRDAAFALKAEGLDLISNQVKFNLLDRDIEKNGILVAAKELGVTLIAYSPLAQGVLTGTYHDNPELIRKKSGPRKWFSRFSEKGLEKTRPLIEELKALASAYGVTPAEVALNWVINFYDETVIAIPGASKPSHAASNARAMAFQLTRRELDRLDEVSQRVVSA